MLVQAKRSKERNDGLCTLAVYTYPVVIQN